FCYQRKSLCILICDAPLVYISSIIFNHKNHINMFITQHLGEVVALVILISITIIPPIRKATFQLLFGVMFIPEHCIGLVIKKFTLGGARLPEGRIIATNKEAGYQADTLAPGLHWGLWSWQYEIKLQELITVPNGQI